MKKMEVTIIGLFFNVTEAVITIPVNLPKCSKILTAFVKTKNINPCLWVNYMVPSDAKEAYCKFQFVIVRCENDEFEFDEHNYIGTIDIGNDTFAIFYKKAE